MKLEQELLLDFRDVLIKPKRSTLTSRSEVNLVREYVFKHSKFSYSGVPILGANMDGVGTIEMAKALYPHRLGVALKKSYTFEELDFFDMEEESGYAWATFGTSDSDKLVDHMEGNEHAMICLDVANGYQEVFVDFVTVVRRLYPKASIMAGNVVTGAMTEALILAGADVVKVGIGPGSVCTTRKMTGVGYPQLSAIIECADAAHGLGGLICADGGCQVPGDVAKAFGAGADFVMLGSMLAGHKEGMEDCWFGNTIDGQPAVEFYGMSSETAQDKHNGGVAKYKASEGKTVKIKYKGDVEPTVLEILGGIRSTCTYVGASTLKDLSKCTTFVRVSRQLNDQYQ